MNRLGTLMTALLVGALGITLVACIVLTILARDPVPANDGLTLAVLAVFGGVGFLVARRQPGNPVGWILLAVPTLALTQTVARLYSVLDYRLHDGSLPLGAAAVYWDGAYSLLSLLFGFPVILLFPDGRLSGRWRRFVWAYSILAVLFMASQFAGQATARLGPHVQVDIRGDTSSSGGSVASVGWFLAPLFVLSWASFVGRQIAAWRGSTGDRREQQKWLMSGAAIALVSSVAAVVGGSGSSTASRVVGDVSIVGIGALPLGIGVGILRYRLYEIDRIISRTLSYALLSGLLVGTFAGLVLVTTRLLPISSSIGVAASTLVAAGLANPLRARLQRFVDRRFNRARYDTDALVAAFSHRLRDAVELETVLDELTAATSSSLQPAHVTIWLRGQSAS